MILYIVGVFSAYATRLWGHTIHFHFKLQGARYLQGHIFLYNFCNCKVLQGCNIYGMVRLFVDKEE